MTYNARSAKRSGPAWLATATATALCAGQLRGEFRVPPYLQHVTQNAVSIVWWSSDHTVGILDWGPAPEYGRRTVSQPQQQSAITSVIDGREDASRHPYRHEVRLTELRANTRYNYRVNQGGSVWAAHFMTAPGLQTDFSFAVAADPESKGNDSLRSRIHRSVLALMRAKRPRFVVYAGDLVDQGNAQDDWDGFWQDVLGPSATESLASSVPIYAALGNHDYDGLNTTLGGNKIPYAQPFAERGVARYRAYFTFPPNDHPPSDPRRERYYRFTCGPVTIIVLDTNNDSHSTGDATTNWDTGRFVQHPLAGEHEPAEPGGRSFAPDIHGGDGKADSRQYRWLAKTLERAARTSAFVFVVNHQAPYSSFVHGDPENAQSGHPLRKLDALFHRYGVAAVLSGHDEAYERSVTSDNGDLHYYVLPTISDPTGLREPVQNATWQREYTRYIYPAGARHHGYLIVRIDYLDSGEYQATLTPYYLDPSDPTNTDLHYDDVIRLTRRLPDRSTTGAKPRG